MRVLDSLVTNWSGLARPANPARLFLAKGAGGLGYTKVSVLYQKLHLSKQVLSHDPCVKFLPSQQDEQSTGTAFFPAMEVREHFKRIQGLTTNSKDKSKAERKK